MSLEYTYMDSPVGQLMLVGEGEVLHYLSLPSGKMYFKPKPYWAVSYTHLTLPTIYSV